MVIHIYNKLLYLTNLRELLAYCRGYVTSDFDLLVRLMLITPSSSVYELSRSVIVSTHYVGCQGPRQSLNRRSQWAHHREHIANSHGIATVGV